jgi:hypothetical protein
MTIIDTAHGRVRKIDIVVLVAMAGTSGAAIISHSFGPVGMRYAVPAIVLPSMIVLAGIVFLGKRRPDRFAIITDRVVAGAIWGLLATFAYDAIRPILVWVFDFTFDPYKAMPVFGSLILDKPTDTLGAELVGWGYHFWNGIGFGIMFALVRPRGPWLHGLIWGVFLEGIMIVVYPEFLNAQIDDAGFLTTGFVGHAVWGIVLGAGLKKWGPRV